MFQKRHEIECSEIKKRFILTIKSNGSVTINSKEYEDYSLIKEVSSRSSDIENYKEALDFIIHEIKTLNYRVTSSFTKESGADNLFRFYAKYFNYSPLSGEIRYVINPLYNHEHVYDEDYKSQVKESKDFFYKNIDELIDESNSILNKLKKSILAN